ncbi:MAG: TlpA disulfide reductase family protein [Ignavibacteria bacterium]|nr:TlpA disulfide reductase family protein [Ignavibacteria bacterium]
MKRIISLIMFVVLFTAALSLAQDKNFIYTPEKPKPGDMLTLQFSTALENKDMSVIIYSVKNGVLNAEEFPVKKEINHWQYKYQIPDTSQALGIKLIVTDSEFGNQVKQKTFPIQLFDKSGKLLKGTNAASAYIVGYQGVVNDKADLKSAYGLYKEEFTRNPSLAKYYTLQYCDLINSQEDKNANNLIKKVLSRVGKESLDEKQLMSLQNVYTSILKDEQKAKQLRDLIAKKFPTGISIEREEINNVYKNLSDIEKAKTLLGEFTKKFPKSESCYVMSANILQNLCKQGKLDEAKEYLKSMNVEFDDEKWTWQYGSFANITNICLSNGKDMPFTEQLNGISLKIANKLINSTKPNPNWLTASQYGYMTKEFSSYCYLVAAKVYEKTKGLKEALKIAEEGYQLSRFSKDLQRTYARLLVENDRAEEGMKMIDNMISTGNVSEELLAIHKKAYSKIKRSEEGYERYLSDTREKFLNKFKEEIKFSLVNKEAPAFTLTDLDGKKVSLADFKGKTVILDFWATWCAPCKASFPLMKKALEKYSTGNDIVFLFVNTFERSGKVGENAAKFIKTNNYTFHVLVDGDSRVASAYDVTGIPAKIFIDKEGKIRYTAVGFEAETMLEEIDTVINLIK